MRRTWGRGAMAAAVAAVAVAGACAPRFESGATLGVTGLGGFPVLSWPAAVDYDEGQTIAAYEVEVDGVVVTTVPAPTQSCVVTGLTPGATSTLSVTAIDSAGERSAGVADGGRLSSSWTTPAARATGPVVGCAPLTDTDGDRLPDAVETALGSSPVGVDSDADGLRDGDELLGTTDGLALPEMGTSPTRKDLLFEYDWFDDALDPGECAAHSHRPSATALQRVTAMFAAAPVANPDGSTGINVIHDYGQGGPFTGGNQVPDADGVIAGGVNGADFAAIKAAHFAPNRNGAFRYVLMPHRYNTTSSSSGQAELPGDDLIVSLQCYGSTTNVANTIVHEVGHNLNLRHGGDVDTNWKPNYNSVMNYRYQFPGVDASDCNVTGNGILAYSRGTRVALNESAVDESIGVCGSPALDWNGNGLLDTATYSRDLNRDSSNVGDGLFQTLRDVDDWARVAAALAYIAVDGDGAPLRPSAPEIVTEQPVPHSHR